MSERAHAPETRAIDEVSTFIWGSCVSRDTFGFLPEQFTLNRYVARQSLISAGSDASSIRPQLTELSSSFQQRMVRGDLAGDLYSALRLQGPQTDVVLIDLVDERGGVIRFEAGYATKLSEFWGAGGREASRNAKQIPFGTDEHFALWAEGARRFVGALRDAELLPHTLVLHAPWATHYDTGEELEVPEWMTRPEVANAQYRRYVDLLRLSGLKVAELPAELTRTSRDHQWGASPFHYQASAYEFFAREIEALAASTAENSSSSASAGAPVMARRDTSPWGDGDFTEATSVEEIPDSLDGSTYLTVWHNGYPLDLYIEDQGAETTLVSFHAALGSSSLKPPVFTGRAISQSSGMNRVFVSDPGLLASEELGLAWYLGTDRLNVTALLTATIRTIQERIGARHLVFFGMSGGGFAALNLSHEFPGSLAVPVNPQTRILDYAEVHWDAMAQACFGAQDVEQSRAVLESHARADMRRLYAAGFDTTCSTADPHISTHLIPWFEAIDWRDRAMIHFGSWGAGHVPPPAPVLRQMLDAVAGVHGDWTQLADVWGSSTQPTRALVKERTNR
jgi:hypothetical protein